MPSESPTGTSTVRTRQTRATRRAIVAAATELFVEQGYAATTIDAVAARAGVARKTVFSSVGGKGVLLKLAWDWAVVGDDEPVPMSERPGVRAIIAEPDPRRQVRLWVDLQLGVDARAAPLGTVVLAAADVDPEARELLDLIRSETLWGARAFVDHLAAAGGLRSDLAPERAAEACWALVNSLLQHLLVGSRGWAIGDYRDWLIRVAEATLLEPGATERGPAPLLVTRHAEQRRYEAASGTRRVGHLTFEETDRLLVLLDTHVDPGPDGDAAADALVRRAVGDVRADGTLQVLAVCPYVTWWLARHPGAGGR